VSVVPERSAPQRYRNRKLATTPKRLGAAGLGLPVLLEIAPPSLAKAMVSWWPVLVSVACSRGLGIVHSSLQLA